MNTARPHLVILGLMGVGKSTTATAVAEARSLPCFDSDADIEAIFGQTGAEIVQQQGVDNLHDAEEAVLLGRLADDTPSVISAAAWVVEAPLCRQALAERAVVVVLHASVAEIFRRAATGKHRRPIDRATVKALEVRRLPLFAQVADLELDATRPTAELVDEVNQLLDH